MTLTAKVIAVDRPTVTVVVRLSIRIDDVNEPFPVNATAIVNRCEGDDSD